MSRIIFSSRTSSILLPSNMSTRGRGYYNWRKHVRGGGRSRGGSRSSQREQALPNSDHLPILSREDLESSCRRIHGKQYPAYRDLTGAAYQFDNFKLFVDHVQSDPYANPSHLRVEIPLSGLNYPQEWTSTRDYRIALSDFLTRKFHGVCAAAGYSQRVVGGGWKSGKGGDISILRPGQQILERSCLKFHPSCIEVRFSVGLPAEGRRIMGDWASEILTMNLPRALGQSFEMHSLQPALVWKHLTTFSDSQALRRSLDQHGLVAFVPDGAILPRSAGNSQEPLQGTNVVKFLSPESMKVTLKAPHVGEISGMGIKKGVTLIVGGGFHGKSTLLQALELGVYDHIPGDGREMVVSNANALKIRAEDGRSITNVDISPFISNLPFGASTTEFSSSDASGSTSQAANIIEGLESGASTLLIDEDTSATNFMIRDELMQQIVSVDKEPITPFISRVRSIYSELGVSSVLVIGGCGDYFSVADKVLMMNCYQPSDVTQQAKQAFQELGRPHLKVRTDFGSVSARVPVLSALGQAQMSNRVKTPDMNKVLFGTQEIDLGALEQLVERAQTQLIADALIHLQSRTDIAGLTFSELLDRLDASFDDETIGIVPY